MTLQHLKYAVKVADVGSMNEAAKQLLISQPSLSAAIRALEKEIDIAIFQRTNKGVFVTAEGSAFLEYARQIVVQYEYIEHQYIYAGEKKKHFAVSAQHYAFAVKAFVNTVRQLDLTQYQTAIRETKTDRIISDVRSFKSELGIIYLSRANESYMKKRLHNENLEFHDLFSCGIYAYLWKGNALAKQQWVTYRQLQVYPYLIFEQGEDSVSFLAEELESRHSFPNVIRTNDRATMMELIREMNAFTVCCGILDDAYKQQGFIAVPVETDEIMKIGYVTVKNAELSPAGQEYVRQLSLFGTQA